MILDLTAILAGIVALILGGAMLGGWAPTNPGTVAMVVFAGLGSLIPEIERMWRR
jgi:hypothetical protein